MSYRKLSLVGLVMILLLSGCDDTSSPTFSLDFTVTDVQGQTHRLTDYRGRVVIVDIWGTWCPPCQAGIRSFVQLQEKYGPEGLQIIGLAYEQSAPKSATRTVQAFMTANGINYPCALGTKDILAQIPDFTGFPTTIFLDKTGQVRAKADGLHKYKYLESIVTRLLAE